MSRMKRNKVKHVTVRVTQSERDELTKRAAGRSLSDYIRGRVLSKQTRAPLQLSERETIRQLSEISELVTDFSRHVETHLTLMRGEIIDFLGNVENELQTIRFSILKNGSGHGNC
ncbi:plasmid mobilization protein [Sulfitobacter litoralis]|uniref:plasmid mobilization protein n=1 Tax=Sulfitobacter litoralis TaxID=335975 RepID=UPI003AB9A4F4